MLTRTTGIIALILFCTTFLFHFSAKRQVTSIFRGSDADWTYLALAIVYAVVLTAMFYFLTGYVLKKKRYV